MKKNYVSPTMEELSVEDMQLLVGSGNNYAGSGGTQGGEGGNNDMSARETQFDEFE